MIVRLHIKENNNLLPKLGYRTVLEKDSKWLKLQINSLKFGEKSKQ